MSASSESLKFAAGLRLVGGRYAFSPVMLLGSAPLLIFGFAATEVSAGTTDRWWGYAAVGLLGQLALALVFALAAIALSFRSSPRRYPWWWVIAVYLVAGQVRVVVLVLGLEAYGLSNEVDYAARVVTSALLIPLAFGFGSYALETLGQYREAREKLITNLVAATVDMDRQQLAVQSLRQGVLAGVEQEITEANNDTQVALAHLENQIAQGVDVRPELQELLEQSDRRWRRISYDTWERAAITLPKPTLRELLDVLAKSKPVSLVALALSAIFLFALVLVRALDFWPAVFWTVAWMAVVIPLSWAVNELGSRVSVRELLASLLGLVTLLAFGSLFLLHPDLGEAAARGAFTIHITNVLSALIIGSAPSLLRNQELVLVALQRRLDQSTIDRIRTESELVVVAQQVASRLHGNARGEFLARVLHLQSALDRDDSAGALEAVRALRDSLAEPGSPVNESSDEELLAFIANWRGFVDIEHNLSGLDVPEALHGPINTLVMDAVSNAVRHGKAGWIRISVEPEGEHWVLTVVNDGEPPAETMFAGVGSRVLDHHTSGQWTLHSDSSGLTTLIARLQA